MVPSPTVPDPSVPAKLSRRRFTAAEKARILDVYEVASDIERAALCRRERIYSSLLSRWRKQRGSGRPLSTQRGPKPNPKAAEAAQSQKRIAELERKLAKAEQVIDIQGKVYALLRACAGESADGLDLPPWSKRSST
jgi:transposase-like protein